MGDLLLAQKVQKSEGSQHCKEAGKEDHRPNDHFRDVGLLDEGQRHGLQSGQAAHEASAWHGPLLKKNLFQLSFSDGIHAAALAMNFVQPNVTLLTMMMVMDADVGWNVIHMQF